MNNSNFIGKSHNSCYIDHNCNRDEYYSIYSNNLEQVYTITNREVHSDEKMADSNEKRNIDNYYRISRESNSDPHYRIKILDIILKRDSLV